MVTIKDSKPIEKVTKGEIMIVDGKKLTVDAHYVMIDHGNTNEMAIELYDPKAKEDDGDFQIRYFSDQAKESMRFFALKQILYEEQEVGKIEW